MAHSPRKMIVPAMPEAPAALTPSSAPRMTMAIFTKSSGRQASRRPSASCGSMLLIRIPTTSATMKPASVVSPMDQPIPNLVCASGVAAMWALAPSMKQISLMKKTIVNALTKRPTLPPSILMPTESTAVTPT